MNRENIKKVRDVIAGLPEERFDMRVLAMFRGRPGPMVFPTNRTVRHSRNTVACIAGWTNALLGDRSSRDDDSDTAADRLGLSLQEGNDLFTPTGYDMARYSRAQAVAVLDHLLTTGKVDWSVAEQVPA